MRRALTIAAAVSLAAAAPALAQDDHHGGPPGGHAGPPSGGMHGGPPHGGPPAGGFHGGPPSGGFHGGPPGGGFHPPSAQAHWHGSHGGAPVHVNTHVSVNVHTTYRAPGGHVFHGSRGSGQGFHGGGHFTYHGRSFARFHVAPFAYPAGWGYRSWSVGAYLPSLFFTSAYFIGDWGAYDLGPPPSGYQWVRYGPDALLVAPDGRIVDVVHGVFWW